MSRLAQALSGADTLTLPHRRKARLLLVPQCELGVGAGTQQAVPYVQTHADAGRRVRPAYEAT